LARNPAATGATLGGLTASLLVAVAPVLLAAVAGAAVAAGGRMLVLAAASALFFLLLVPEPAMAKRLRTGYLAVEAPILLLLLSTLVFRHRDVTTLSENPLDSAALYRVACLVAALVLGGMALVAQRARSREPSPRFPLAFRLYLLYVLVVFLGAPLSLHPALTAYRGLELAAGAIVLAGAFRSLGFEAVARIERLLYGFIVALIGSVWLGVVLFPGQALLYYTNAPLHVQIQGAYPQFSSNGVGELGVILALWSLGRVVSPGPDRLRPAVGVPMAALGTVTLVAAQFRTGYVIAAVGAALLLAFRGQKVLSVLAVSIAIFASVWGGRIDDRAEPFLLRGQTRTQASELSGRRYFWSQAMPVWRRSPVFGRGLVTGTRFEVLAPAGFTYTSTIHSTWVEALVGTGVVGVGLLAASLLVVCWRAFGELFRRGGTVVPALLLAAITIRTITGSTFEIFGITSLLFLTLVLTLEARRRPVRAARAEA
jgi:O-Antigen ligase